MSKFHMYASDDSWDEFFLLDSNFCLKLVL